MAFGDDSSDADGFAVLQAARAAGILDGLAVGVTGPHGMPDEVRAAADVILDTPRDVARALSPSRGPSSASGDPAARSDPVDPAQDDGRHGRQRHDDRGHRPEAGRLAAVSAAPASLIPKIPATAPIPARMTVTPVSRFMITDRLLLTWVR